jgi:hypothetical protein
MSSVGLALLIFRWCDVVIMTERLHKTIVALCSAAVGHHPALVGNGLGLVWAEMARSPMRASMS